jgi:tetratricopeptide (TPR) repeat protein
LPLALILATGSGALAQVELGSTETLKAHLENLRPAGKVNAEAAINLALGHSRLGDFKLAHNWLTRAVDLGAEPLRIKMLRADFYTRDLKWELAFSAWFDLMEAAPENPHAPFVLWTLLREREAPSGFDVRRVREALVALGFHLEPSPARPPDRPQAQLLREQGDLALKAGRFGEAADLFRASIAAADDEAQSYLLLSKTYDRLKQPERAVNTLRLYLHLEIRENRDRRTAQQRVDEAERSLGLALEKRRR